MVPDSPPLIFLQIRKASKKALDVASLVTHRRKVQLYDNISR